MSAFDLLSEPIRRYIYDRGWRDLRPIQAAAIQKIMGDERNYILVSPTASGKTEAAFLPILSKVDLRAPGVAVLYISPLIALINDQFIRIDDLCKYLDIPVTRWHGEANRTDKDHLITHPEGIVLITPESIEALFVNKYYAARQLFSALRYVIVDEIHSFLGTDRGIQLRSLLSRLRALQNRPFPLIGLSATLGDYEPAKQFTGDAQNTAILRDNTIRIPEAIFRYFEGGDGELPQTLLKDLYQEVADKKSLIFPNTRGRAEEVAVKLKRIALHAGGHENYFSHHSSVDKEVREYIEHFAKNSIANPFAIACTSTLELGIDIGTVDQVVQIDATFSIASLVQRVGRSGRREDAKSRLLFYATNPWSLLQAVACWQLYLASFIDPIVIDDQPFDILLHQMLSMIKERSGIDRKALVKELGSNIAFRSIHIADVETLIDFLVEKGILEQLRAELIIGIDGEPIVDSREFYSVFTSEEQFRVLHNGNRVGEIPFTPQVRPGENILLAARIWSIKSVDERAKRIDVQPALDGKKPIFGGSGGKVHPRVREKMLEILLTDTAFPWLDGPATDTLRTLREEFFAFRPSNHATRPIRQSATNCLAFTFTGTAINRTISLLLHHHDIDHLLFERESLFEIKQPLDTFLGAWTAIRSPNADPDPIIRAQLEKSPSLLSFSKWGSLLPLQYQVQVLKNRYFDFPETRKFFETMDWELIGGDQSLGD